MNNEFSAMSNEQLVDEFNRIWKDTGVSRSNINRYMKHHHSGLYQEILRRTAKLNKYVDLERDDKKQHVISIFERLHCLANGLDDRPMCIECNVRHVSGFMPYKDSYSQYCSQFCQKHSSIQAQRGLEKKRLKYGQGNATNAKKGMQTRLKRYGKHHPDSFADKVKMTKKMRYGDEGFVNVEKAKATVQRHKAENPNYYHDIREKTRQTNIKNGHDPDWNNREKFKHTVSQFTDEKKNEIQAKRKTTCIAVYGVENPMQNKEIQAKAQHTCMTSYGVTCPLNTEKSYTRMVDKFRSNAWEQFLAKDIAIEPLFSREDFIAGNAAGKLWRWRCKKCGHEFMHKWNATYISCPSCVKHDFMGMQHDVCQFIKSICSNDIIRENDRTTFSNKAEIDILDASKNIAVELNGLIWHNIDMHVYACRKIHMMYHSDKTDMCASKGIRLIHVFEDEWIEHKQLCKSKLKKLLCPENVRCIDAHECSICTDVDEDFKNKFMQKYTFYSIDTPTIAYSLKIRSRTAAMMTFMQTTSNEWQILNYAETHHFIVKEGFKVLLDAFCADMKPNRVCFSESRDWNTADDFSDAMTFSGMHSPAMFWMKRQHRFRADGIDQSSMSALLKHIDSSKSFIENMNMNGYYRIYDSGILVFERQSTCI